MFKFTSLITLGALFTVSGMSFGYAKTLTLTASNPLNLSRPDETISVKWQELEKSLGKINNLKNAAVFDPATGKQLPSQAVDTNCDGSIDELIFQWNFHPHECRQFKIKCSDKPFSPVGDPKAFCRFVPERLDDFAWENDRVAFRMYGPALKKELNSSGVDVWAKRTRNLIINKWYASRDYHTDHGEGMDFYGVGLSRGCGGSGIWKNGRLFVSDNFASYKVIANGPIRAIFELYYGDWNADGLEVSEIKRVTLDAGSNLSRFDITYSCKPDVESLDFAAGLAKRAVMKSEKNVKDGWLVLWEPENPQRCEVGALGTAVIADKPEQSGFAENDDHLLLTMKAITGKPTTYYAGFGWTRSGDFSDMQDWVNYVSSFAQRVHSPVKILLSSK